MILYADHAATTPLRPEALEAMRPWLEGLCGNASSVHGPGRAARRAVEEARARVAAAIGARPDEVVFTSGGTESDTLAVAGGARARREEEPARRALLFPATEHSAVREAALMLAAEGFSPRELPVGADGTAPAGSFAPLGEAALVSAMLANNETGVVFPGLPDLARRAREAGALVHTDAVQAVGKVPVDAAALGVDLLSFTAHKLGGPKGIGALYVRRGVRLRPLQPGGGQEKGRRGGTEDVASIAGFAAALEAAVANREAEAARLARLRDAFEAGVARLGPAVVHGAGAPRLPGTSSIAFPGLLAETLLAALDLEGVAASSGSACSSGTTKPSRILLAAGVPREEVLATVRFSFGWTTSEADVERLLALLPGLLARVREAAFT